MEPDQINNEVIIPIRTSVMDKIFQFQLGQLEGYDNLHQIVEEGIWDAYHRGLNENVVVIEGLTELQEAIKETVLEYYNEKST